MYRFVKKTAVAALGCGAIAALLVPTAVAASAAAAKPAAPAKPAALAVKTNFRLNAVGSDTIYCVDNDFATGINQGIFAKYNAKQAGATGNGNQAVDTPPFGNINLGCQTTPSTTTVAADTQHPVLNYTIPTTSGGTGNPCATPLSGVAQPWGFPAGSSAGITCFVDDQGAGNVAFARSSRGRGSSDPANLEFWAFALDAVTWTKNSANTHAPSTLTPAQINAIYTCAVTNWNQVGGTSGAITRYFPQVGSGTGKFFAQLYLNNVYPSNTGSCPSTYVPENDGSQIAAGDLGTAILPYSFAVYTAQTNGAESNLTNGQLLEKVNGVKPSNGTVSEAAAFANIAGNACTASPPPSGFCGSRYVYHVTWQAAIAPPGGFGLPAAYYAATIDLIGVPASGTSGANSVCSGKYSTILKRYGFKGLTSGTTSESTAWNGGVPGNSKCRLF